MIRRRQIVPNDPAIKQYLSTVATPGTFDVRDARKFAERSREANAAQGAAFGSVAARNDPNRFGSAASREMPSAFGPAPARALGNPLADTREAAQPAAFEPAAFDGPANQSIRRRRNTVLSLV